MSWWTMIRYHHYKCHLGLVPDVELPVSSTITAILLKEKSILLWGDSCSHGDNCSTNAYIHYACGTFKSRCWLGFGIKFTKLDKFCCISSLDLFQQRPKKRYPLASLDEDVGRLDVPPPSPRCNPCGANRGHLRPWNHTNDDYIRIATHRKKF